MYDFLTKGMEGLPDVEPAQLPFIDRFGTQASNIFGWLRENQDMLKEGAGFIQGLFNRKAPVAKSPSANPLPPING